MQFTFCTCSNPSIAIVQYIVENISFNQRNTLKRVLLVRNILFNYFQLYISLFLSVFFTLCSLLGVNSIHVKIIKTMMMMMMMMMIMILMMIVVMMIMMMMVMTMMMMMIMMMMMMMIMMILVMMMMMMLMIVVVLAGRGLRVLILTP